MSDLVSRLARIQRELAALKAGFAGGETRFFGSEFTSKTFNIVADGPRTIRVEFPYQDFPQLYVAVYYEANADPELWYIAPRKSMYEWRVNLPSISPENWRLECVLLSEQVPTYFEVEP